MKKISVEIVQGNVLSVDAKGFVVPQFADKMSLTGVSGILSQNGHFCGIRDYAVVARQRRLPFGYSFVTDGRDGVKMLNVSLLGVSAPDAFGMVQLSTFAALAEAEKNGLDRIVMPALGTGKSGSLSFTRSAKAMLSAIESYAPLAQGFLKNVTICIFKGNKAFRDYKNVAGKKSYRAYVNDELEIWNEVNRRSLMRNA